MLTTGGFVYAQVVNIQRADRPQGRRLPGFLKNAENVPQDFSLRGVNPDRPPVIRENEAKLVIRIFDSAGFEKVRPSVSMQLVNLEKQFPDAGEIPRFRPPDICHMKGSFRFS